MSFYPLLQSSRVPAAPKKYNDQSSIIIRGLEYDTYEGWRKRSYQVQRGQRSYMKDIEGTALFSEEQVKKLEPRSTQPHWTEDDSDGEDDSCFGASMLDFF